MTRIFGVPTLLALYILAAVISVIAIVIHIIRSRRWKKSSQRRGQYRRLSQDDMQKTENRETLKEAQTPQLKCQCCDGYYVFRRGKNGPFVGCSNYGSKGCHSTLSIEEFVRRLLREHGVNIYAWEKECGSCGKLTTVYSYYLVHDFKKYIPELELVEEIGIGDIPTLDAFIAKQFPNIERSSSRAMGATYWANRCQKCHALQGKNYVVEDPDNEKIWDILMTDGDLNPYLVKTLKLTVTESDIIERITAAICSFF